MDELMLKKAIKGDKQSFSKAVLQVKDEAYRIASCYLHNEEDSMDAVCDAVEKALINIKTLREPKFFKSWYIRIVINECKSQLRKRKTVILLADGLYKDEMQPNYKREEKLDLEKLLEQMEPLDRLLIYMKYYMGYTLDEMASALELPAGTVKSKLYRNLKEMKVKLEVKEGIYEG